MNTEDLYDLVMAYNTESAFGFTTRDMHALLKQLGVSPEDFSLVIGENVIGKFTIFYRTDVYYALAKILFNRERDTL